MTKYAIAAALAAFVSANAGADYQALVKGNPDASVYQPSAEIAGVQPGVGSSFDLYYGLAEGNPSLFQTRERTGDAGDRPNIYEGFRANPDLSY
jgi:hypothetical protein